MASGLSNVFLLALFVTLAPGVFGGTDCDSYRDQSNFLHPSQTCWIGFCCGECYKRYCCTNSFYRLTEDAQDECFFNNPPFNQVPVVAAGVVFLIFIFAIVICCCVCPCCCLYKLCRQPRPVVATTTVINSGPQQYPQQQTATPSQPYQHYPPYQPIPVQPGYPAQPMPQGYGAQGQPFTAGPPPTYQEATGPSYPVAPYSQAAFNPGQPAYPLQPPVQPQPQPQPSNLPAQADFLTQPAYNPEFMAPPPKTG